MNKNTTSAVATGTGEVTITSTDASTTRPGAALRRQARELIAEGARLDTLAGHPAPSDLKLDIKGFNVLLEAAEDTDGLTFATAYAEECMPGVVVLRITRSSEGGESALDEEFLFSSTEVRKLMTVLDLEAEDADSVEY